MEQETTQQIDISAPSELQELLQAGAHLGHQKSRVHPNMLPYIFGVRNNVHIIDLTKTQEKLEEAQEAVKQAAAGGQKILFVGTKLPVRELVKNKAEESNAYHITEHWVGGTLTNWDTISKSIDRLKEIEEKKQSGELDKYVKHERLEMEREMEKLQEQWGGIKDMESLPDLVFVTDMYEDDLAVAEAKKLGIPIVAIADTNVNPQDAKYPIPANDDTIASVTYITEKISSAIAEGLK